MRRSHYNPHFNPKPILALTGLVVMIGLGINALTDSENNAGRRSATSHQVYQVNYTPITSTNAYTLPAR